jgi:hypothetical protein
MRAMPGLKKSKELKNKASDGNPNPVRSTAAVVRKRDDRHAPIFYSVLAKKSEPCRLFRKSETQGRAFLPLRRRAESR